MITRTLVSRSLKLTAALLVTAAALLAFEGRIDMQLTTSKSKTPMTQHYLVKGKLMRIETPSESKKPKSDDKKRLAAEKKHKGDDTIKKDDTNGEEEKDESVVSILDVEKMEMTTLMASEKMYMVLKMPAAVMKEVDKTKNENPFKPTGRKETIAGVEAEEYAGQTGKTWTEIWVTKELGQIMMSGGGKPNSKGNAWDSFLSSENYFSLRTISRAKAGAPEDMRMETTKVERTHLDDSLFVPPPDYKKMEMPDMGSMLKGLMP